MAPSSGKNNLTQIKDKNVDTCMHKRALIHNVINILFFSISHMY